ncbi:MAG TPA: hypothetical protein VNO35_32565 [Steroidobacteraceae bacterium]|nr:hypothetical protein [Steroidobacteraceae bacterium]
MADVCLAQAPTVTTGADPHSAKSAMVADVRHDDGCVARGLPLRPASLRGDTGGFY